MGVVVETWKQHYHTTTFWVRETRAAAKKEWGWVRTYNRQTDSQNSRKQDGVVVCVPLSGNKNIIIRIAGGCFDDSKTF